MSRDRITQIRIRGLRVIEDITLDLTGLTVLIGDNGAGKSTILEAFEILRRAATSRDFVQDVLLTGFGPLEELIRYGQSELSLGVVIQSADGLQLEYSLTVARSGTWDGHVQHESLRDRATSNELMLRDGDRATPAAGGPAYSSLEEALQNTRAGPIKLSPHELALTAFGRSAPPALERVRVALEGIELHVAFDSRPLWQQRELEIRKGPRSPNELILTRAVERYGLNLHNVLLELKNDQEGWERLLWRAGLAVPDLKDFRHSPTGRGSFEMLAVLERNPDRPVPLTSFSEGQLAFLLLAALPELEDSRSVLLFDEPETHLHPQLQVNALHIFERVAESCPVLLATHSDRMLDALEDPVKSVVLCELDEHRALRLLRPDQRKLDLWLESYRGLGSLRAEGYDFAVFDPDRLAQGKKR